MQLRTFFSYMIGRREAILAIAADRSALATGLLFVLSAGLAREYDGEDLLHRPAILLLPLISSMVVAFFLFVTTHSFQRGPSFFPAFGSFLGLFWMTAPLAWLYAIPYERFLSEAGAVRANLLTLGIVSVWRVALLARVLVVIMDYGGWAAFFVVMAVADSVALILQSALPVPLADVMGGLRVSPGDAVLQQAAASTMLAGGCTLPIWLVGAVASRYQSTPSWKVPGARGSWSNPRGGMARLFAYGLLLLGFALLPIGQPEQMLRRRVEDLFRGRKVPEALALMSSHEQRNFPPHWNPPPRFTTLETSDYREAKQLLAIWDCIDEHTASWVRATYLDKFRKMVDSSQELQDTELQPRIITLLQQLPEGPGIVRDLAWHDYEKTHLRESLPDPRFSEEKEINEGIRPRNAGGYLNLDFETSTLWCWTAEGDAFTGQPIEGDTVAKRRSDMKSEHQGRYWIGGFERHGDEPQGTLTSVPFKVTHPYASFLVGGGAHASTRVEIVSKDTDKVIARVSGENEENLRRVVVDLRPEKGQEIFIRLVDRHSGDWGHINFDDFRFHAAKPNVPERRVPSPDVHNHAGLSPQEAAQAMTVPEGFTVKLFAGEPDVHQPIAFCLDDRGRVWVAEAYSYPVRRPDNEARDRILIFEDTDGDGHFDKKTVFLEGLNLVSGLEIGFGGVWIGAAPYLMFVPMKDDKPAGKPQILLDGWAYQDTHETLNTFTWGPDGWLYGCHGVFTHSRVGKPGTPDNERVPINAGIWRYHPTKHQFEVFAHGTSNPWGLDFNDWGQMFCEACVIPHAFHIIQGGRYHRQAGSHFNPYTYADIQTIADHRHYIGATPHSGNERSNSAGGGHAHCGTMIYLGGAWPGEYRNQMFMGNIHGRRLNMDQLRRQGSGYVASHGPDFLLANDAWARFINMRYGPDGNVYLIDWYDKQACHHRDINIWDRTNGRIYKIEHRGTKPAQVDLAKCSDDELVRYQVHPNDWFVRHARRLLQERYGSGRQAGTAAKGKVQQALAKIALEEPKAEYRLRGLWALHVIEGIGLPWFSWGRGLVDDNEFVAAWTVQLALEDRRTVDDDLRKCLAMMAGGYHSPVVRLYLASGLQRLPLAERWPILEELLAHDAEDAKDHNLRLMYWYAAEPLAAEDPGRALDLAAHSKVPLLEFMARRVGAIGTPQARAILVERLQHAAKEDMQLAFLAGLQESLRGRQQAEMPARWPEIFPKLSDSHNPAVHDRAVAVAVAFGDSQAAALLRAVLASPQAELPARRNALSALLEVRDKALAPLLQQLLTEPALRSAALRGLAAYDDPNTPAAIMKVYPLLTSEEKRDALGTLAARATYANALLDAVASKQIPATQIPADIVRQLRGLNDAQLQKRLGEIWGTVREAHADRVRLMRQYRKLLSAPPKTAPDLALGRAIFVKTCAQCHALFGSGGSIGPELTGSNRANLDYLLENILDPSAVIPKEYAVTRLTLQDGRVVSGIVKSETAQALTVIAVNETLTVPTGEIETRQPTDTSMMPDDLLKPLSETEVCALVAYLQSPAQAPLLATADNARDFFNGKDLTGWEGDPKLWTVENGEIVGKSTGLKKNHFLRSQMAAENFRLSLKVKLTPNKENSGVQFRSQALPDGEMKGYQADIGAGWWGKLYEEHGRGVLWNKEANVKADDWNEYVVEANGSRIRTYVNGKLSVDLDDPHGARRGVFGLQIHAGGPMEVRFKELRLEVKP